MSRLSTEQVLKDKQTRDPNSITSLSLTHKALFHVSCLSDFINLEKLDLASNSLTSLEGLSLCRNLKWLSVVQNKLKSLKGIEGLSKLTVLNAGKNQIQSMDEIRSLVSLRALILNDNEIISICKLDQNKELNTLVLSRNPIREIGESLVKVSSLSKISLSNCQLQTLGSSLKSCIALKELRLAHNEIKILPAELAYNKILENLDLGNNVITNWSDVKVLKLLTNLKNLNIQGNPIAEREKLTKKVLKSLPNLRVFNAKPIDKSTKMGDSDKVDDFSLVPTEPEVPKGKKKDSMNRISLSKHETDKSKSSIDNISDVNMDLNKLSSNEAFPIRRDEIMVEKKLKRKKSQHQDNGNNFDMEDSKQKRNKTVENLSEKDEQIKGKVKNRVEKKPKSKNSEKLDELDVIDDGETSFADLFSINAVESFDHSAEPEMEMMRKAGEDKNSMGGLVVVSGKKKKNKNKGGDHAVQLPVDVEVGMGGPSTWGDV